jgi:acetylornithine deacetylase
MKSGVAAMVYALHAVKKAGFGLNAPVTIETVIEEECSGNGALACIAAGYDADAVLIPEPFGPAILTPQVGVAWFKVTVNGVPRHVLEAPAGTNAIEKNYPVIDGLRRLESELKAGDIPAAYDGIDHPIN